MRKLPLIICLSMLLAACKKDPDPKVWDIESLRAYNLAKINISKGMAGTLIREEGNCQPANKELMDKYCKRFPVSRIIRIYEYTLESQTEKKGRFYTKVNTQLIKSVVSDSEGFFQAELLPGKYSVFTEDSVGLYAEWMDGSYGLNSVSIDSGVSVFNLKLDYALD